MKIWLPLRGRAFKLLQPWEVDLIHCHENDDLLTKVGKDPDYKSHWTNDRFTDNTKTLYKRTKHVFVPDTVFSIRSVSSKKRNRKREYSSEDYFILNVESVPFSSLGKSKIWIQLAQIENAEIHDVNIAVPAKSLKLSKSKIFDYVSINVRNEQFINVQNELFDMYKGYQQSYGRYGYSHNVNVQTFTDFERYGFVNFFKNAFCYNRRYEVNARPKMNKLPGGGFERIFEYDTTPMSTNHSTFKMIVCSNETDQEVTSFEFSV